VKTAGGSVARQDMWLTAVAGIIQEWQTARTTHQQSQIANQFLHKLNFLVDLGLQQRMPAWRKLLKGGVTPFQYGPLPADEHLHKATADREDAWHGHYATLADFICANPT
jgi:hypothetical protein